MNDPSVPEFSANMPSLSQYGPISPRMAPLAARALHCRILYLVSCRQIRSEAAPFPGLGDNS